MDDHVDDVEYGFLPEKMRHHLSRTSDDIDEKDAVNLARRERSANIVGDIYSNPSSNQLYTQSIEQTITRRKTFDKALVDLGRYFDVVNDRLKSLDQAYPTVVPAWLFDSTRMTSLPTLLQVQRQIISLVERCLPECDAYLAFYEPFPLDHHEEIFRFVACTSKSSMAGQMLSRHPTTISNQEEGIGRQAMTITWEASRKLRPVEFKNIARLDDTRVCRYSTETETGPVVSFPFLSLSQQFAHGVMNVDACRLSRRLLPETMTSSSLTAFMTRMKLPDVASVVQKNNITGAQFLQLSVTEIQHHPRFQKLKVTSRQRLLDIVKALREGVPLHLESLPQLFHDDEHAILFLQKLTVDSGSFIDGFRGIQAHRSLADVTKDPHCTVYDVFSQLLQAIGQSVSGVTRAVVWKTRVGSKAHIDTIATTELPADRFDPFIHWKEGQLRRVPLYKEDKGELVRGTLVRINRPEVLNGVEDMGKMHSLATYVVAWSSSNVETFTWTKLRQQLAIRPMNIKHFQLNLLLKEVGKQLIASNPTDVATDSMIELSDPHGVAFILQDNILPQQTCYTLQVDLKRQCDITSGIKAFLLRAVAIANTNLRCVREREARRKVRKVSVEQLQHLTQSMGMTPSNDSLRSLNEVVQEAFKNIAQNLPGTRAYVAELQPCGYELKCTFLSEGKRTSTPVLQRGRCVAFSSVDHGTSVVLDSLSPLRSRLRSEEQKLVNVYGDDQSLIIYIPLLYEDICIGVLGVSCFNEVPLSRPDETHPEDGVVKYLEDIAKCIAKAIYLKRRSFILFQLQELMKDPLLTPQQIYFHTCKSFITIVVGSERCRLVEVNFDKRHTTVFYNFNEAEQETINSEDFKLISPLRLRQNELFCDTVASQCKLSSEEANRVLSIVSSRSEVSSQPLEAKYFHLIADFAPSQSTSKAHEKYLVHSVKTLLGTEAFWYARLPLLECLNTQVLLTCTVAHPREAGACEQLFCERLSSLASNLLTNVQARVRRTRDRQAALKQFQQACKTTPSESVEHCYEQQAQTRSTLEEMQVEEQEKLQVMMVQLIERVLHGPNVYIGLYEPTLHRLRYTCASSRSSMKGKHLNYGRGVSFQCLEREIPLVYLESNPKIRNFADQGNLTSFPFLVVPIGRLGVLALDDLSAYAHNAGEVQPELGLMDFLRSIASLLAGAITIARVLTEQKRSQHRSAVLNRMIKCCENFNTKVGFVQQLLVDEIAATLPSSNAYVGFLRPLCKAINFTYASSRSSMGMRILRTDECLTFNVFTSQHPLMFARVERPALTHKNQKILYKGEGIEGSNRQLQVFHDDVLGKAFICVPIPFIGLLYVDSIGGACASSFGTQVPDNDVVEWVKTIALHLGHFCRQQREARSKACLSSLFKGNKSTFEVVFQRVMEEVIDNLPDVIGVEIVQWDEATDALRNILARQMTDTQVSILATKKYGSAAFKTAYQANCLYAIDPNIIVVEFEKTRDVNDDDASHYQTLMILKRVDGATWSYPFEYLEMILPLVNNLIRQINPRVELIVRRRNALQYIRQLQMDLNALPSNTAKNILPSSVNEALTLISSAASLEGANVYIGERQIGGTEFVYTQTSSSSGMSGVTLDLRSESVQSLPVIQCLNKQETKIMSLQDLKCAADAHGFGKQQPRNALIIKPVGVDRIACMDSMGMDAFVFERFSLEEDVISYFYQSASIVGDIMDETEQRYCFDVLSKVANLWQPTMDAFYSTLLQIVRRYFVSVHSQQVLSLADDFTGMFQVGWWHKAPFPRSLQYKEPHYCFRHNCRTDLICSCNIHREKLLALPMTNLPRTLDIARSEQKPSHGFEKVRKWSSSCLAAMLDREYKSPRIALCIYSYEKLADHPSSDVGFSPEQQQFFYRLSAHAEEVYTAVFRSFVLYTASEELSYLLREQCPLTEVTVRRSENNTSTSHMVTLVSWHSTDRVNILPPTELNVVDVLIKEGKSFKTSIAEFVVTNTVEITRETTPVSPQKTPKKSRFQFKRPKLKHPAATSPTESKSSLATSIPIKTQEIQQLHKFHIIYHARTFVYRDYTDVVTVASEVASQLEADNVSNKLQSTINASQRMMQEAFLDFSGFGRALTLHLNGDDAHDCILRSFLLRSALSEYIAEATVQDRDLLRTLRSILTGASPQETLALHLILSNELENAETRVTTIAMRALLVLTGKDAVFVKSLQTLEFFKEYLKVQPISIITSLVDDIQNQNRWDTVLKAKVYLDSACTFADIVELMKCPLCAFYDVLCAASALVKYYMSQVKHAEDSALSLAQKTTTIQSAYRCYRARMLFQARKLQFQSARIIQCAYRQRIARRRVQFLRLCRAAVKIQRAYRKKLERRRGHHKIYTSMLKDIRSVKKHGSEHGDRDEDAIANESSWQTGMESFESFPAFSKSKVGKRQLKEEESKIRKHIEELAKARESLSVEDRLMEEIRDMFELMDAENIGELDRHTMSALMERLHIPLTPSERMDVIEMMDDDKSGAISFQEFERWFGHEYSVLHKRSRECGVVLKKDWKWVCEHSARSSLRKKWMARRMHQKSKEFLQDPRLELKEKSDRVQSLNSDGNAGA